MLVLLMGSLRWVDCRTAIRGGVMLSIVDGEFDSWEFVIPVVL